MQRSSGRHKVESLWVSEVVGSTWHNSANIDSRSLRFEGVLGWGGLKSPALWYTLGVLSSTAQAFRENFTWAAFDLEMI